VHSIVWESGSCEGIVQGIAQEASCWPSRIHHTYVTLLSCGSMVCQMLRLSTKPLAEPIQHSCKALLVWNSLYMEASSHLGVPSQHVILLQGGTNTQLPCNFLAMLGGTLQAQARGVRNGKKRYGVEIFRIDMWAWTI